MSIDSYWYLYLCLVPIRALHSALHQLKARYFPPTATVIAMIFYGHKDLFQNVLKPLPYLLSPLTIFKISLWSFFLTNKYSITSHWNDFIYFSEVTVCFANYALTFWSVYPVKTNPSQVSLNPMQFSASPHWQQLFYLSSFSRPVMYSWIMVMPFLRPVAP